MAQAYIVEALRTAGGKRNGRLADWHPADLAALMLDTLVDRSGIDPAVVEDVIMGCVSQVGEQSLQVGRTAVLASSLPESVPAVTIDRQCGSSLQAVHFAAQAVMSGTQDVVIAAGVESMTRVPMGASGRWTPDYEPGSATSRRIAEKYPGIAFSQFMGAEMMAEKHGFDRDALNRFALESHRRASAATRAGAFGAEIVPVPITEPGGEPQLHVTDEGIRHDATLEGIASVKTILEGGRISAATASQICDGASAVLVVSERALRDHGLRPIARIHTLAVTAGDPVIMLEEPLRATEIALRRAGMRIEDIDLYEMNEAFAPVPLAWLKHSGADPERMNVNGGAIALGHPLGASGTKLTATLIHALRARGLRHGLVTMCEGGGVANAAIIEAL